MTAETPREEEETEETEESGSSLSATRLARGTIWAALDNWTQQLSQLAGFIVIGNIVGPEVFGIMSMAMLYALFAHALLVDSFAEAIVQRLEVEREHLEAAFWSLIALGGTAMLVSLMFADAVADFFAEPLVSPVIRWLSVSFLVVGAASLLQSKLRREFNFRALAGRSLIAYGGAAGTGIVLALLGYGLWSLVIYQLALRLLDFLLLLAISRWLPRPRFSWSHLQELLQFGISNIGNRLLGLFAEHTDRILVGYFLGPHALGIYAIANRVVDGASNALAGVMHNVAFSAFARLQDDRAQMQAAIMFATRLASLVVFPVFAGLALVAPVLVDMVLSEEWRPAGTIIRILSIACIAGFTYPVSYLVISALMALGRADQVLYMGIATVVVRSAMCFWAVQEDVMAVAIAVTAFEFLALPMRLYLVNRQIRLDILGYVRQMIPAALATVVMAACVFGTYVATEGMVPAAACALLVAAGVVTYTATLFVVARSSLKTVIRAVAGRR